MDHSYSRRQPDLLLLRRKRTQNNIHVFLTENTTVTLATKLLMLKIRFVTVITSRYDYSHRQQTLLSQRTRRTMIESLISRRLKLLGLSSTAANKATVARAFIKFSRIDLSHAPLSTRVPNSKERAESRSRATGSNHDENLITTITVSKAAWARISATALE